MKITKMERVPEGHLAARVTLEVGARTVPVHRKYGSWLQDVPGRPGAMAEIPRAVAVALQEKARLFEKREAAGEPQEIDEVAA